MRVCVVGSGGREHALAAVLSRTADVVVAPGNPGIPGSVDTDPEEVDADLFVIGPESLLVDGLADRLRATGRLVFGPGADGAELEGSKAFMKQVLAEAEVPSARFGAFTEIEPALAYLRSLPGPYVVKTSGLAAGKGVLVSTSLIEAEDDVRAKLSGSSFGDAGRTVVIEEYLDGPELSLFAICDGTRAVALPLARDFKRLGDGDTGPNTGGMGAYTPAPGVGPDLEAEVLDTMVLPTLTVLRNRGIDYRGVLYAGLVQTADGLRMLEYNVRFGDPEAQVVLPRITTDLAALLAEAAAGELHSTPAFCDDTMVTVVCASEGYPGPPRTGDRIEGLSAARATAGVEVFCAGVARADPPGASRTDANRAGASRPGPGQPSTGHDDLVTHGGRVLSVVGRGPSLAEATRRAYAGVAHIHWPGMHNRSDIAAGSNEEPT